MAFEFTGGADSGQHQNLGGIRGSRRQDHFPAGIDPSHLAMFIDKLDTNHPLILDDETMNGCLQDHVKIGATTGGGEIGGRSPRAEAVTLHHIKETGPFWCRPVKICRQRNTAFDTGFDKSGREWGAMSGARNMNWSTIAMKLGRPPMVMF